MFKNPVPTLPPTYCVPITNINLLALFREVITVHPENHTQQINTWCKVTVVKKDIHCFTAVTIYKLCISLQSYIMRCDLLVLIFTASVLTVSGFDPDLEMEQIPDDEARARIYLDYLDKEFSKRATQSALADWAYASNITEENLKNKVSTAAV